MKRINLFLLFIIINNKNNYGAKLYNKVFTDDFSIGGRESEDFNPLSTGINRRCLYNITIDKSAKNCNVINNNNFKEKYKNTGYVSEGVFARIDYSFPEFIALNGYINLIIPSIHTNFSLCVGANNFQNQPLNYSAWIGCHPGESHYSISYFANIQTSGNRTPIAKDLTLYFSSVDPEFLDTVCSITSIIINDPDPIPEPFSMISLGSGCFAFIRKKRQKLTGINKNIHFIKG